MSKRRVVKTKQQEQATEAYRQEADRLFVARAGLDALKSRLETIELQIPIQEALIHKLEGRLPRLEREARAQGMGNTNLRESIALREKYASKLTGLDKEIAVLEQKKGSPHD